MILCEKTDAGQQTRRLFFGRLPARGWRVNNRGEVVWFDEGLEPPPLPGRATWQGDSAARWEIAPDPGAPERMVVSIRPAGNVYFSGHLRNNFQVCAEVVGGRYRFGASCSPLL